MPGLGLPEHFNLTLLTLMYERNYFMEEKKQDGKLKDLNKG